MLPGFTPPFGSQRMKVAVRMWSATILLARSVSSASLGEGSGPPEAPVVVESSSIFAMIGAKISVSNTVAAPESMHTVRSTPMPVSTLWRPSGSNVPSAFLLYCMNTLFQISMYLPQWQPGRQSGPHLGLPVSMNISVSGPHGPVVPAGPHQLSSRGSGKMWSSGRPCRFQRAIASSSRGMPSSPANTVT